MVGWVYRFKRRWRAGIASSKISVFPAIRYLSGSRSGA